MEKTFIFETTKTDTKMKKIAFDIIVIVLVALLLIILSRLDLLEKSAKFMLIPILVFYYVGQYVERKFRK
jgi:hypothetical protein